MCVIGLCVWGEGGGKQKCAKLRATGKAWELNLILNDFNLPRTQVVQHEVTYCSQYVSQSRSRLVEEFEKWYKAAFIGDTEEEKSKEEVRYITATVYMVEPLHNLDTLGKYPD